MRKILFIVPRMNIGGAETYVYTIAKELALSGRYEVFLASGGGKLSDELEQFGVKTFFVPIRLGLRFCKWFSVSWLARLIKKYDIDIVHANSGAAGVLAARLKKKVSVPIVYTAHSIFENIKREYIINVVDKIICVSNYVRKCAIEQKFSPDKLLTRYNGIDVKRFSPDLEIRAELRGKYGISDNTLVLITCSRIKNLQHKGHADLLKIFSDYAKDDNWMLIVVGKGHGLYKFKYEVDKLGLQNKIICLGHRTDVEKIMNMADVYVSPTQFETFGLAFAEGMANGKPAIVYNIGGTPEVVCDGYSGYLVKYKDTREMYDRIKYIDKNRGLLDEMSANSIEWIERNFSIEKMIKELEEIYDSVSSK